MNIPFLIFLFLSFTSINSSIGQTKNRTQVFFKQMIDELSNEIDSSDYYRSIIIEGQTLSWDTSEYKGFLVPIDTSDYSLLEIKHLPTRKKIIAFINLINENDYDFFKNKLVSQNNKPSIFPITFKSNAKSSNRLIVSYSRPILNKDKNILVIREVRKYNGTDWSDWTKVYTYSDGRWKLWDTIKSKSLFH